MFEWRKQPSRLGKYVAVGALVAVIAAIVIWCCGLSEQLRTGVIATHASVSSTHTSLNPAEDSQDHVWFRGDGSFMTVQDGVGVFSWHQQGAQLRKRQIFDFAVLMTNVAKRVRPAVSASETQPTPQPSGSSPPAGSPARFDVEPYVFPDASKVLIYHQGILALFPHDWDGGDAGVEVAYLEHGGRHVPTALAVIHDRIAVAHQDGIIEFRKLTDLTPVLEKTASPVTYPSVNNPSIMKVSGDLLEVVSTRDAKITELNALNLYNVKTLRTVDYPPTAQKDFRLEISDQGRMAIGNRSPNVYLSPSTGSGNAVTSLAAYGSVYAFSFLSFPDKDRLVVGGDFQHVYLVGEGEEPFKIADSQRGVTALAVNSNRIVFAGYDGVVLLAHSKKLVLNRIGWATIIVFGGFLFGAVQVWNYRKSSVATEALIASQPAEEDEAPPAPPLQLPEVPTDLVKAFRDGECVLYCGSGVSAQAGFPYWQPFVRDLTEWAISENFVDAGFDVSLRALLAQGQYDSVSDNLVSIMRNRQGKLNKYLSDIFLRKATLPDSVKLLKDLPFSAAMTTNFDNLLEQAFDDKSTASLTPADAELLLQCLHKREFFLLKLYGKLEKPDTVMLAPSQYDDFTKGNLVYSSFMETLLISRTVFFVGSSLEGIQAYLKGMGLSRQSRRTHYALVPVIGEAWQAKAYPLKDRYGIEVLPYSPSSEEHPEVLKFLQNLDAQVKEKSEVATARVEQGTVLKSISVTDIGPFESLELKFDPHWNILLGDNGVGKSSIIKAIAIAILGEDSKSYAQRIIKAGKPNSTITLESGRATYTTKLFRKNGEAKVESIPGRAFEAEGWLAVAFPPLRTVSWVRPQSAETGTTGRERPTPDDLLPVIVGEADPRLDKLKQWIVNVDYRIKDAKSRNQDSEQYERLLNDFFDVVRELTEGTKIEFKEVNPATKEITVITDDGELPIEALSQGMTSLIGWVGILLQRLYEVYGKDDDPKKRYALVLMDEIDAHLHPAWQQSLIGKLSKIFPNVQFIATTHSPLIVGGMNPDQIVRFARDEDDKVVTYPVYEEMTIGRADQILSSDLFGLPSTLRLTPELERSMKDYHDLLKKDRSERTAAEEARFKELRETLKEKIPPVAETPAEQKAMRLVRALVESDGDSEYDRENQLLLDRAEKLLDEVSKKPR